MTYIEMIFIMSAIGWGACGHAILTNKNDSFKDPAFVLAGIFGLICGMIIGSTASA